MPIKFYYEAMSQPCRGVMLTAKALGVPLEKKFVNLLEGEHMTPEYLEMNPQHCVPTVVFEDGFTLWESRAIQTYMIAKYGKDDSLYPKDPKKRAEIDFLLHFDNGTLFSRMGKYFSPIAFFGKAPDENAKKSLIEAIGYLDGFLSKYKFAAADHITVADHSLVGTVSQVTGIGIDFSQFPNVKRWLENCKKEMIGYDTECGEGEAAAAERFQAEIKKFQ